MKTLWSELEFAGRALIVVLALVVLATPIGVGLLVQRTHAAGLDSPLDWVSVGHRTSIAEEATYTAQNLDTLYGAPTLVKAAPLATMQGGAGAIKRGTPTTVPTAAPTAGPAPSATPAGAIATATAPGPGYSRGLKRPGVPSTATPVTPSGTIAALGTTSLEPPPATSGTLVAHYVELPDGGVATLIQLSDLAILVDGGGSLENGILLDYILAQGLVHLDMVIVTRYDEAHAAELPGIIPLLAPDILWIPDDASPGERAVSESEQLLFDLEAEVGGDHYTPKAGEGYWYDELHIECLYSGGAAAGAGALAVRLTYGEMAMLFTGDADAERALTLAAFRPRAEALRLAQDTAGAEGLDADTAAVLMDAVLPEFAIYSGGEPRSPLLEGIDVAGVPVYATADYGTLRFVTDGYLYQLEADRVPTPTP